MAPTRAFRQQPTEVLDLPVPDPKKLVDPNASTRRTTMQPKMLDDDDDDLDLHMDASADGFEDPAGTEVLGAYDERAVNPNITSPEAFKPPPLNSDMRALHEVARLPTAIHEPIADSPGEGTDTHADEHERGHPSGFDLDDEESNPFESPTDGYARQPMTAESDSPFSETVRTDEEYAPSDEPRAAPPSNDLEAPPHSDPVQQRYYEDIQGAFNAAPVFDPRAVANTVLSDDAFKPRASADWPELSLEAPVAPAKQRSPFVVLGIFVAVLAVTIGGVGVGFRFLGKGGDNPRIWGDLVEQEKAARAALPPTEGSGEGEEAPTEGDDPDEPAAVATGDEPEAADDERSQTWRQAERAAAAPALAGIDAAWRKKTVAVKLTRADDTSKSGFDKIDKNLAAAFAGTLKEDRHARWRLRSRRMKTGWEVTLTISHLQIASGTAETVVRARCDAVAVPKRMKRNKLKREVEVEQRLPTPAPTTLPAEIARDIAKACGYRLGWDFVASALD